MAPYDWPRVTASLFRHLQDAGAAITRVNDGGEWIETHSFAEALDAATGVDEAWVRVQLNDESSATLYLVYDGDPEELVADYAYRGPSDWLQRALIRFSEAWDGKPCPTINE
jgi:hypothetical protein